MEVEVSTSQNKVSIKKLKELRDTITELEVCEQAEILKIIEKNKAKFTENKNGVFINMNKLSDKAIEDIEIFLEYIQNNYKKNLI
tara:strand:+ start:61 stop:315 length:255 start_codon:yes stop_codon:yes gene_type:complete